MYTAHIIESSIICVLYDIRTHMTKPSIFAKRQKEIIHSRKLNLIEFCYNTRSSESITQHNLNSSRLA